MKEFLIDIKFQADQKAPIPKSSYPPKCFITLVLGLIVQLGFDDQLLITQNTKCDSK